MMNSQLFNVLCYLLGSMFSAAALINLPEVGPYTAAMGAFGAALLAAGRWDKVKMMPPGGPTALLLVLALGVAGCPAHGCDPVPTPTEVKDCAQESAKSEFYNLLPRVRTILSSGGNRDVIANELATVVGKYGLSFVTCLVSAIGGEANASLAVYGDDPVNTRIANNAAQWLADHGN